MQGRSSGDIAWQTLDQRWLLILSALYALLRGFNTVKAIVRLFLRGEPWSGGDFPAFYATAMASYRLDLSPYVASETIQAATGVPSAFATTYPPMSILVFVPYTFVDITSAFILHSLLNFVASGAIFYFLYRMFLAEIGNRYVLIAFVGLLFWESISSRDNFLRGQTNLIIAALVLFAWHHLRNGKRTWTSGVAIGIAALIKVYFGLFAAALLLLRPRSGFVAAMAVIAIATALSLAFFPAAGWADWIGGVLPAADLGRNAPDAEYASSTLNHSLNGLLARNVKDPFLIKAIGYPLVATIAFASGWAIWRLRRSERSAAVDRAVPLMLATVFLLAPLSWVANYVYLWIALVATYAHFGRRRQPSIAWTMGFLGLLTVFCLPWSEFTFGSYEKLFGIVPTTAAFLTWLLCLREAWGVAGVPSATAKA